MPREKRETWLDWCVRNYDALANLGQPPYGDYAVETAAGTATGSAGLREGTLVGSIGLVPSFGPFEKLPWFRARLAPTMEPNERFTPEMGMFWAVHSEWRGSGYATEAARAIAAFAFATCHVDRLVATTEHDNVASIGVMKRLGMVIEKNPDPDPVWFQVIGVWESDR
jgi:RimJ/RimL family protein N-acetyltransferase